MNMIPSARTGDHSLDALVQAVLAGTGQTSATAETLPPQVYSSQAFYDLEVERIFKKDWLEISLSKIEASFNAGDEVTPDILHDRGLIKKAKHDVVILGNGEISKSLKISAHRFTKTAKEKIEKAGGTATLITKEASA